MRVAYLSPLPPEESGIADYSAELLPGLRQRLDIDLFSACTAPLSESLSGQAVRSYRQFPVAHGAKPYDAVVYHLGNNPVYHAEIYQLLLRIPGILVLHEYMLHHLIRAISNDAEYAGTLRYCYGIDDRTLVERLRNGGDAEEMWSYPLFERAVDASLGVVVHSGSARARILRSRPGVRAAVVPMSASLQAMPTVSTASRRALRAELGLPADGPVIASFGHINPPKRIDVALRGFARLRTRVSSAAYVLSGELSPHAVDLHKMLASPLGQGVVVTGRVSLARMLELMDLADVVINLRYPVGGETSATCVRVLAMGKPVIVSTGGWFSDIGDGCCARVEPGRFEEDELTAVLESLVADERLRADMGAAAMRWAGEHHSLERAVAAYTSFVTEVVRTPRSITPPAPDLAPKPSSGAGAALAADIAAAAAELGVSDDDQQLLPVLADILVASGLADVRS